MIGFGHQYHPVTTTILRLLMCVVTSNPIYTDSFATLEAV